MKKPELISLLTEACQSSIGLVIASNDPNRLRQRLYALRRENPEYSHLSFVVPPGETIDTLYIIVKTEADNAENES